MQIRQAVFDDLDELIPFYIRMNEVINVRNNDYNPDNDVFPSVEMVKDAIEHGQQFVGIEDGIIVAGAIVNHDCKEEYEAVHWNVNAKKNERWILHALRVAPEYEGRGFAKQMLAFLIALAPERGQKAIRLDVLEGYSVERLYHHFDFRYVDTVEMTYEDIGYPKRFRLLERVI